MSEELRPCPFCGGTKICTEKSINLNYCDNCSAESNIEHWNIRPIEDELQKRIAELEAEIGQLTAHSDIERQDDKWIPVSERLPEFGDVVLVCDSKGYVKKDFRYDADGKWMLTDFVRHWMPLPEAPKEREE